MTSSRAGGANLFAVLNLCKAGDSIISVPDIYGGTVKLFAATLKRLGIGVYFCRQR